MLAIIGVGILTFLAVAYYYIIRQNNYWKDYGVPHDKPKFFFGHLKEVMMGDKHIAMQYTEIYRKFKSSPYCGFFKLMEPGVVINDLELVKTVLVKEFASFANNDFQIDGNIDPIWGSNAFVQIGEKWKKTRSMWTSSLTATRMKAAYDELKATSDVMVDFFKKKSKENPNKQYEARLLMSQFFTDAIVRSVFGLEMNSFENPNNGYLKIAQSLFVPTFWDNIVVLLFTFAPTLSKLLKLRFVPKSTEKELLRLSKDILNIREKTGYQKNNAFDAILLNSGTKMVTELEIAGIMFGFLLDGTETSSGVGGFLLYALAAHPDVQAKLRDEIDEAYEMNDEQLSFDVLHALPYLDMVLCETLRMYPPLIASQRLCTKSFDLPPIKPSGKPVRIAEGMTVVVPVYGLHLDPEHYPDPERFDPERFSEVNKPSIPKYSYLPFGDGPRICLGMRFAMNQMKVGVAALIRNFEIRLAPHMIGKPIVIDPNVFVFRNVGDLWITLHDRNSN